MYLHLYISFGDVFAHFKYTYCLPVHILLQRLQSTKQQLFHQTLKLNQDFCKLSGKKCILISFTCLVHSKVESDIRKNLSNATGFSACCQLVIDDKGSQSQKFLKRQLPYKKFTFFSLQIQLEILNSFPDFQFRYTHLLCQVKKRYPHRKMRNKNINLVSINLDGICHLTLRRQKKAAIFSLDDLLFSVSSSNLVFQKRDPKVESGLLTRLLFLGDSYPLIAYLFFDSNRIEIKSYSSKSAPVVSDHCSYF